MANQTVTNNALTTVYVASEATWTDDNLPDELFQLEPHPGWGTNQLQFLNDANGNPRRDNRGRMYLDFPLPPQISIRPEDWRLEMYSDRLDPRIQTRDLHLRMVPGPNDTLLSSNAMNMQKARLRKYLHLPRWERLSKEPQLQDCLFHEPLSLNSVRHNTVLELNNIGMNKPTLGTVANPLTLIPLDRFLQNHQPHMPSEALERIFNCIAKLQDKAIDNQCAHWIFLENRHKPRAWRATADRAGPNDIAFPKPHNMPRKAVEWIKNCVRQAAVTREPVPDLNRIPAHAIAWVQECIGEGRAGEAEGNFNHLQIDHLIGPVEMTAEEWDYFMQGDWW